MAEEAELAALAAEARLVRGVRWRLVAFSGLSTLLVLAVLGVALYASVAGVLAAAGERQLAERAAPLVAYLQGERPERPPEGIGAFAGGGGGTFLMLLDATGARVGLGRVPPDVPAGLPDARSAAAAQTTATGRDVRADTIGGTPVRVLSQSVVAVNGSTYVVQAVGDRSTEVRTLDTLLLVLGLGGLVVVVVASGFGAVYARRALVPIRDSLAAQRLALRRQREFAADASHELRTPLTVIRTSVELLRRHPDRPVGEATDVVDDIDAEVSGLTSLVDDLLLLARSESGAVALERLPVDLGDVAADAASSLAPAARARDVTVTVDPEPAMVDGDPGRLRQLVLILVDNAVRHSPRGGRVQVTVRESGGVAGVEVADEGPGVRPEDMAHVFDRFWRAPDEPGGGTGLGLAIAKWIAERHGGRIGVANREAGGALFRAEVPAAAAATPPA